jgi:hypothetical protein
MENGLKAIGCFAEVVKPAGPEEAMPQSFYASNPGEIRPKRHHVPQSFKDMPGVKGQGLP